MADGNKGDDQIYGVILGLLCGITVIGLMGPIGMLVASATILIGTLAGVGHAGGALIGLAGAGLGMVMVDPVDWLLGPMRDMAEIYRVYLFEGRPLRRRRSACLLLDPSAARSRLGALHAARCLCRRLLPGRLAALLGQSASSDGARQAGENRATQGTRRRAAGELSALDRCVPRYASRFFFRNSRE